jgi:hypothetical protein
MAVVVVIPIRLRVPVDTVGPEVARAFPAAFHSLPGFQRIYFLKVAETEAIAVIVWSSAEQAQAGADSLGRVAAWGPAPLRVSLWLGRKGAAAQNEQTP